MVYSAKSDDLNTISQFTRRKTVTTTTGGTNTPANYQVKLTIAYESEMQSDFDDIRFNTQDGDYIDYWIESRISLTTATVWVELPDAITHPGNDTIFMFYGNSELSDGGSGDDTFELFDDFGEITNPWIRYSGNPIFIKNPTNPSWDYYFTNSPYIAINSDGTPYKDGSDRYYMYYSGSGNTDGRVFNEDRTGLARSTDLYNWTRVTSTVTPLGPAHDGLVLDHGAGGTWDDCDVQIGTIIVKDGTFHMWYTGNDNSVSDNTALGYASSSDGITWTKYAGNPILDNGVGDDDEDLYAPYVIFDSDTNTWKMWYIGERLAGSPDTGVMYATAPVNEPWNMTKYSVNYVYTYGTANMWGPYVWKETPTSYHMIFSDYNANFHHATSNDGISWTYDGIIFKGESGEWDESIYWISQIQVNGLWYTYYRGNDAFETSIGLATGNIRVPTPASDTLDLSKWTKTEVGTGTVTQKQEELILYSGGAGSRGYVDSNINIGSDVIIEFNAKLPTTGAYCEGGLGQRYGAGDSDVITFLDATTTNPDWYLNSKRAGVAGISTQVAGDALYHDFEIIRETNQIRWYIDNVLKKTESNTSYIPIVSIPVSFGSHYSNTTGYAYIDDIIVRKYITNEPIPSYGIAQHQRRIAQFM